MADNTITEIKDRLDIAEVIGGYVQLKKAGTNFKGLCPFHSERTPSFVVTPARQIWHCFGCSEGGDVFSFVQKVENLDFPQTLKLLADRAGVKLPEHRTAANKGQTDEKELLVRINTFAAKYYHEILFSGEGKEALNYLTKRGLKKETIKDWVIGYAPVDFQKLNSALKKKNVRENEAVKAGVLVKNEKGSVYDRFRGRITFPVFNYLGEVVGFSARVLPSLDDGKMGKYINTPETLIYNKSRILFGLYQAKNFVRKQDEVIVVEGQMDCISAHEAGFKNTVASSGTAITAEHLTMLGRLTKNLKFCLDADQAGLLATRRAVEHILGKDFNIKIVEIDGLAKDPDELIQKNPDLWKKAVEKAPLFFDYYIARLFSRVPSLDLESKKKIRDELWPLLRKLTDPLEKEHYIKLLASKLDTTPTALMQDLNRAGKTQVLGKKQTEPSEKSASEAEKFVLGGMLNDPIFLKKVLAEGEALDFRVLEVREAVNDLFEAGGVLEKTLTSTVAKEALFVVESLQEESASTEAFQKDLTNAFFALRVRALKVKQSLLLAGIKEAEERKKISTLADLQREFAQVSKLINKFNPK